MTDLPDRPRGPTDLVPGERLTSEQFEMVIRRAAELQARAAEDPGSDGMAEEEVLRIGRELGLSGAYLGQALAEVRGGPAEERGLLVKLMGEAHHGTSRVIRGEPEAIRRRLETYLVECEYLTVQRRLPDRTVFVRAAGMGAMLGRAASGMFRRQPLLDVQQLEVTVREVEEGMSYVSLATDLGGRRTEHLAGGLVLGGMFGGTGALVLGVALAPPVALVGLPVLAGSVWGMRYGYAAVVRKLLVQLEALLDQLQHDELPSPARRLTSPR